MNEDEKKKHADYQRQWRKANAEHYKQSRKLWERRNPEKLKLYAESYWRRRLGIPQQDSWKVIYREED